MSAEEIFVLARKQMPKIVRATIYNNLNFLTEKGMIRRVKVAGHPDRYDRTLYPHDHLICDICGDLSDISIGDLKEELQLKTGMEITGYELNLHYVCPRCAGEGKKQR